MTERADLSNAEWVECEAPPHYNSNGEEIEKEPEGDRSYIVAQAYFSPKGKKWPIYSYVINDLYKVYERDHFANRYTASISFKATPTSWWTEVGSTHGGCPPQILKALAKKLLEVLP